MENLDDVILYESEDTIIMINNNELLKYSSQTITSSSQATGLFSNDVISVWQTSYIFYDISSYPDKPLLSNRLFTEYDNFTEVYDFNYIDGYFYVSAKTKQRDTIYPYYRNTPKIFKYDRDGLLLDIFDIKASFDTSINLNGDIMATIENGFGVITSTDLIIYFVEGEIINFHQSTLYVLIIFCMTVNLYLPKLKRGDFYTD